MVISLSDLEGFEVGVDILSDRLRINEIHRGTCYRLAFTERNLSSVCREIFGSVQHKGVSEDAAVAFAIEIEICVICEIQDCRGIRLGCKGETEFILLCPFITSDCLQCSRISLLSVLGIVKKFHSAFVLATFPYLVLETFRTAMEMIRAIVYRQCIFHSVKGKFTQGHTVCISSRDLSHTRAVTEIACRICISKGYISKDSILVRNHHRDDSGTDIGQLYISSTLIFKGIKKNLLTTRGSAPKFFRQFHDMSFLFISHRDSKFRVYI